MGREARAGIRKREMAVQQYTTANLVIIRSVITHYLELATRIRNGDRPTDAELDQMIADASSQIDIIDRGQE